MIRSAALMLEGGVVFAVGRGADTREKRLAQNAVTAARRLPSPSSVERVRVRVVCSMASGEVDVSSWSANSTSHPPAALLPFTWRPSREANMKDMNSRILARQLSLGPIPEHCQSCSLIRHAHSMTFASYLVPNHYERIRPRRTSEETHTTHS
jgi:hypothetical protein